MSGLIAAIPDRPQEQIIRGLRGTGAGLAIGLATLAVLFHVEIATAVHTWITSTAYNHCFLVLPIAVYLIWDRRESLRGLIAAPMPSAALLVLPAGVLWLTAERLGIMEGRQFAAMSMVEILSLAMLGRRLWAALSGPLLYLYFLVPFGEFLTPGLQDVTTWLVRHGLDAARIPAYIDGYVIEIPEGTFFVAEACAGLRFLIASIAFGVLYALLMYRASVRRTMFIAVSVVVPVIANGVRAFGIVALGHLLGSAQAAAADHVLYGWVFFSIVILALIALGLPFRQDGQPQPATVPRMVPRRLTARPGWLAGLAVAVLAALGPLVVLGLDRAGAARKIALKPLFLTPPCVAEAMPGSASAERVIIQRVTCGGTPMTIEIRFFAPRSTAGPVNAERRHLTRLPGAEDMTEGPLISRDGITLRGWRLIQAGQPAFLTAAGLWIDGKPMMPGIAMRIRMARDSVTGGSYAPALVIITPLADWARVDVGRKREMEREISELVELHPEIGDQVRAMARGVR